LTRRGLILFALMSVIWGIPYLFIRIAVAEISPSVLVLGRTAIAVLMLLPIALARRKMGPVLQRWRWVLIFAVVEIAIPWVLLGSAEQTISNSLTGLLIAAVPLVATVIALILRSSDRLGVIGVLGILVGIAGVAAIVGTDLGPGNATAIAETAVVAVCYAAGPMILARRLNGLPSTAVMATSLGTCAVLFVPIGALQMPTHVPSPKVLLAVAVLAVVCTVAGFLLFAALIEEIGAVRSTVITYINPAVAALLGVLVLHETFTVGMGAGFALVVLGSTLATRRTQSNPPVVE
jgi:drug/metabolite transporter (DMT)-like permease